MSLGAWVAVIVLAILVGLTVLAVVMIWNFTSCSGQRVDNTGMIFVNHTKVQQLPKSIANGGYRPYLLKPTMRRQLVDLLQQSTQALTDAGVTWWLSGRALLGHVRHGGIVPWDDALDVCVLETDRAKLQTVKWPTHGLVLENVSSNGPWRLRADVWGRWPVVSLHPVVDLGHGVLALRQGGAKNLRLGGWPRDHVLPLESVRFEHFYAWVPCQAEQIVKQGWGPEGVQQAQSTDGRWSRELPWLVNGKMKALVGR
jgi:hypothetical protein